MAVLLGYFVSVMGLLVFVGWLSRPSVLWSNPELCGAIAGITCYPARFLVERTPWWKQLQYPSVRVPAEGEIEGLIRRVRRSALRPLRFSWAARRELRRIRWSTAVTVVAVEASAEAASAFVTFEAEGKTWRLVVDPFDAESLPPGTVARVAGELAQSAWVAVLTSPPLLPQARLDRRGLRSTGC